MELTKISPFLLNKEVHKSQLDDIKSSIIKVLLLLIHMNIGIRLQLQNGFWHIVVNIYVQARHSYALWHYGLWSFQTGGTKLERFLPKNHILKGNY